MFFLLNEIVGYTVLKFESFRSIQMFDFFIKYFILKQLVWYLFNYFIHLGHSFGEHQQ